MGGGNLEIIAEYRFEIMPAGSLLEKISVFLPGRETVKNDFKKTKACRHSINFLPDPINSSRDCFNKLPAGDISAINRLLTQALMSLYRFAYEKAKGKIIRDPITSSSARISYPLTFTRTINE